MAIKRESAFGEDLLSLARENYRTATRLCGECRSYHSVFPYLRIADAVFDVDQQPLLHTALSEVIEKGPAVKWLIAGSADTGLCAALYHFLQLAGVTAPQITIADRCETPLVSCQRFADQMRFQIETRNVDLLKLEELEGFDAILAHGVLPFFGEDEQKPLFDNLSRSLRPGGYLVHSSRYYVANRANDDRVTNKSDRVAKIINALTEGGIDLPDTRPAFVERLEGYASGSRQRTPNLKQPEELAPVLEDAGLRVVDHRSAFVNAAGRPRAYDRTTMYFVTVARKKS